MSHHCLCTSLTTHTDSSFLTLASYAIHTETLLQVCTCFACHQHLLCCSGRRPVPPNEVSGSWRAAESPRMPNWDHFQGVMGTSALNSFNTALVWTGDAFMVEIFSLVRGLAMRLNIFLVIFQLTTTKQTFSSSSNFTYWSLVDINNTLLTKCTKKCKKKHKYFSKNNEKHC